MHHPAPVSGACGGGIPHDGIPQKTEEGAGGLPASPDDDDDDEIEWLRMAEHVTEWQRMHLRVRGRHQRRLALTIPP